MEEGDRGMVEMLMSYIDMRNPREGSESKSLFSLDHVNGAIQQSVKHMDLERRKKI